MNGFLKSLFRVHLSKFVFIRVSHRHVLKRQSKFSKIEILTKIYFFCLLKFRIKNINSAQERRLTKTVRNIRLVILKENVPAVGQAVIVAHQR